MKKRPNRKEYIVAEKPGDCTECPKRPTCRKMCEKVSRWVNQDFVGRNSNIVLEMGRESRPSLSDIGREYLDLANLVQDHFVTPNDNDGDLAEASWEKVKNMRLTEKITRFIFSHYVLGKKIRDIAIEEDASSQTVDGRHKQAKVSIASRLKMEQIWDEVVSHKEFKDIRSFDISFLFYKFHYPGRVIASVLKIHPSTVFKILFGKR